MSFFGGSLYQPIDYMSGINDALAQNAALGASKPKKGGFGNFLGAFAGYLGDSLTGNPIYAQQQAQMAEQEQMEQWYERKRQDELADYEAKKRIEMQYSGPEMPGIAKETDWYSGLDDAGKAQADAYMRQRYPQQFVPPSPTVLPYNAQRVDGGGGEGEIHVNPQTGEQIRFNPQSGQWEKVGGQSGAPAGNFPG
jgi:hypothetical protein